MRPLTPAYSRPSRRDWGWAAAAYAFALVLFFHPLLPHLTTALLGPPEDNMQDFWNTWHSQRAWASIEYDFFHTPLLLFPEGSSLLYHSFAYPALALIGALRLAFFGGSLEVGVLTGLHNAMLLLSFWLAALGAFLLTWQFTKQRLPALIGGYLFAFSPFHFAHALHHVHVANLQFIPWFVLCLMWYLQRPAWPAYLGVVVFFALSALSSWYYLFYNAYFLLFCYGAAAAARRAWWLPEMAGRLGAVLAGTGLVLAPWLVPMAFEGMSNAGAYAPGHNRYVADLAGFVAFHPYHLLSGWTQHLNAQLQGNAWEASVYLGLVNLGLLIWGWRHRQAVARVLPFCLAGMGFFMLWAGGHSLHVLGRPLRFVYLPTALTTYLPLFGNVRTPSRAVVYVYLLLGVAVGVIFKALCFEPRARRYAWQRQPAWRQAVAAALAALVFLDYYSIARAMTPVALPPAYEAIARDPQRPAAVLELPPTYEVGNRAMFYQVLHQHPVVHAIVSRKLAPSLIDRLAFDDLPRLREQLRQAGVRYIVLYKRLLEEPSRFHPAAYARHYRTLYEDAEHAVFRTD